jgi:hypothetical protein
MLKDFLNNSDEDSVVLENASAMAVMMGEDAEVTMEGVSEIVEKFKTRIGNGIEKLRTFIAKIVRWIKEKFFDLLKRNLEVDKNLWKNAQDVLALCDKVQTTAMGKLLNKVKVVSAMKREDLQSMMELKAEIEDTIKNKIEGSQEYTALHGQKYKYSRDEEGANFVRISGKTLAAQSQKFQETLKAIEENVSSLEKLEKAPDTTDLKAKMIEVEIASAMVAADLTRLRMETINKVMSMSKTAVKEFEKK